MELDPASQPVSPATGHILIVDDDELVRDFLLTTLRAGGYSAVAVSNGLEAVEEIRTHAKPDVILLDLNMPGMDGQTFLRLVQEHTGHAFGIIVMTGERGPRLKDKAMRFGAFTVIEKPIQTAELFKLLRIQMDFKRTRSEMR